MEAILWNGTLEKNFQKQNVEMKTEWQKTRALPKWLISNSFWKTEIWIGSYFILSLESAAGGSWVKGSQEKTKKILSSGPAHTGAWLMVFSLENVTIMMKY